MAAFACFKSSKENYDTNGSLAAWPSLPYSHSKKIFFNCNRFKSLFFSFPLHLADCKRFAFSLPVVNALAPSLDSNERSSLKVWLAAPLCQKYEAQVTDPF